MESIILIFLLKINLKIILSEESNKLFIKSLDDQNLNTTSILHMEKEDGGVEGGEADSRATRQLILDLKEFQEQRLKMLALERKRKEMIRIRERDKVTKVLLKAIFKKFDKYYNLNKL